jgi:hypothetical protein
MHFEIVRSRLLTKLVENKFHEKESWQGLRVLIGHDLPMF